MELISITVTLSACLTVAIRLITALLDHCSIPGHGRHITPVCFTFPDLAICPGSPDAMFAFGLFDGDDSNRSVVRALSDEALVFIRNLGTQEITFQGHELRFEKKEGGDMKFVNSSMGLAGCSAECPCLMCERPRSEFGKFDAETEAKYQRVRTLPSLLARSHTVPGVRCDCCSVYVTLDMVAKAKKQADGHDEPGRKLHFQTHKSVLPGVGSLFYTAPQ